MTILIITIAVMVLSIFEINFGVMSIFFKKADFRKLKIDEGKRQVVIENSFYNSSNIESVSVVEDSEQHSLFERCFSRYNCHNYFASILFKLKNGSMVSYNAVSKQQIYKILKKLEPYVELQDNPEYYKVSFLTLDGGSIFGIIFTMIVFFFYIVIHYLNTHN